MNTIGIVRLDQQLRMNRCPHCGVALPMLTRQWATETREHSGTRRRFWGVYLCSTCGGIVTAAGEADGGPVSEIHPAARTASESIPETARSYLAQALGSRHAPAGAVMLASSSINAMLKAKGFTTGSLYERIDAAAGEHKITPEMAAWAHEVRLDANEPRHADTEAPLPSVPDAEKCLDLALAFGEYLFALPERVERGRRTPSPQPEPVAAT